MAKNISISVDILLARRYYRKYILYNKIEILDWIMNKFSEWEKVKNTIVAIAADTSNTSKDISGYMYENATTIIQERNDSLKSTVAKQISMEAIHYEIV